MNRAGILAIWALSAGALEAQLDQQPQVEGPIRIDPAYRSIAAATGGHALPIQPAELATPEAGQLLSALSLYDATILAVDEQQAGQMRSYEFPADASVRGLSVVVSGRAKVVLKGPDGLAVEPGHPDANVIRLSRVTGYMLRNPAPGVWTISVDAAEPFLLTAEAQSDLDILSAKFVEQRGRPGHQGLFPIDGSPASGQEATLELSLMEPLSDVSIGLRRPNGESFGQAEIIRGNGDEYWARIDVPAEPFRVFVRATDAAGHAIQRARSAVFAPQPFLLRMIEASPSVWPGDPAVLPVRFENRGEAASFVAYAVLGDGSAASVTPQQFQAAAGESIELTVRVRLPFSATPGGKIELIVTATDESTGGFNSASQPVFVRSE